MACGVRKPPPAGPLYSLPKAFDQHVRLDRLHAEREAQGGYAARVRCACYSSDNQRDAPIVGPGVCDGADKGRITI